MRRGTTPTLILPITGLDVSELKTIYVTIEQDSLEVTKTNDEILIDTEENVIKVPLSQEETLKFKVGVANVQIRGLLEDDATAIASNIKTLKIGDVLLDGVIEPKEE